jgi:hypothetical protein
VDHVAPKVRVNGGTNLHTNFPFVILNGSASDNRGVKRIEVQQGSGPVVQASGNKRRWYRLSDLRRGRNHFTVRAIDFAGNSSKRVRVTVTYVP